MIRCPLCRILFPRGADIRVRHPNFITFTCPICMTLDQHRMTVVPRCGHAFCNRCFTAYLVRAVDVTVIDVDNSDGSEDNDGDYGEEEDQDSVPEGDN